MSYRLIRRFQHGHSQIQLPLSVYRQQCRRLEFLERLHHGKLAEYRVAELRGGEVIEDYASPIDVVDPGFQTHQVKSSLIRDGKRWSFSNARTKCDFLVLTGEKESTFAEQYLDDAEFVYWRVPGAEVAQVVGASGYLQISTNPDSRSNIRMRVYMIAEIELSRS